MLIGFLLGVLAALAMFVLPTLGVPVWLACSVGYLGVGVCGALVFIDIGRQLIAIVGAMWEQTK